jgi:hypothetical protein
MKNLTVPPAPSTFLEEHRDLEGLIELDDALLVQARSIRIADGTRIITRAHALTLLASEQLVIEGTASIVSFLDAPEFVRPFSEQGRTAGTIGIRAGELIAGLLVIDSHGEDGSAGADGAPGIEGTTGAPANPGRPTVVYDAYPHIFYECHHSRAAGQGGTGGVGGEGQRGAQGGDGANVVIIVERGVADEVRQHFSFITERIDPKTGNRISCGDKPCGGFGGAGGRGGPGGAGGRGGAGANMYPCRGNLPAGSSGVAGAEGQTGPNGEPGAHGQISFRVGLV